MSLLSWGAAAAERKNHAPSRCQRQTWSGCPHPHYRFPGRTTGCRRPAWTVPVLPLPCLHVAAPMRNEPPPAAGGSRTSCTVQRVQHPALSVTRSCAQRRRRETRSERWCGWSIERPAHSRAALNVLKCGGSRSHRATVICSGMIWRMPFCWSSSERRVVGVDRQANVKSDRMKLAPQARNVSPPHDTA